MTKIQRCAIIGYGRIGQLYHKLIRDSSTTLSVTEIADPIAFDSVPGIRVVRDYRESLESDADTVLITTPPKQHYEIAKAALLRGKHVLVEKPPASTALECQDLIQISSECNRVLFFAFHAAYNSSVLHAKPQIHRDTVRAAHAVFQENVLNYHDPGTWVFAEGVLRDSGINAISVLTSLLPNAVFHPLSAEGDWAPDTGTLARIKVIFGFGPYGKGTLNLDWNSHEFETRHVVLETDNDNWMLDIVSGHLYRNGDLATSNADSERFLPGEYEKLIQDFARHLEAGKSSAGIEEVRFVEAIERLICV